MQTFSPLRRTRLRFGQLVLTLSLACSLSLANAATLIDDFANFQEVHSISLPCDGSLPVTSTGLSGLLRSLSITSSIGVDDSARMYSESGDLSIASDSGAAARASVLYTFSDPDKKINLAATANALILDFDIDSDLNAQVEIIANQSAHLVFQASPQLAQYIVFFSSFSLPEVFGQLTSLQFNFNTLEAGDLTLSAISASTVPEPSMVALLAIGLLALRRGKTLVKVV